MATPFFGMRGTGDWPANVRPENWRQTIAYLYPNGQAPLTAMLAMMNSEEVDDPVFHWFEKGLPAQSGAVTGVYTTAGMTVAVSGAVAQGTTVYAKVAEATQREFRVGHQVQFEKDGTPGIEYQGEVIASVPAGADSYLAVTLHEATPATSGLTLNLANLISVIGNLNSEGAHMPDPITYDATEAYNYTQIFRTPLSITRTARKTRLRYGSSAYELAKMECMELHALELEKASWWGKRWAGTGANGKPKRTTRGLIDAIRASAPQNIFDYRTDTAYAGQSWIEGGETWLRSKLLGVYNYGSDEKMAMMGSGAGLGLEQLIRAGADYSIDSTTKAYGINVGEWVLSNGRLYLKTHPLFNQKANYDNAMVIFEPNRIGFSYIDDTFFIEDPPTERTKRNRNRSKDATEEEFITEGGFRHAHAQTGAILYGIGEDNPLTP